MEQLIHRKLCKVILARYDGMIDLGNRTNSQRKGNLLLVILCSKAYKHTHKKRFHDPGNYVVSKQIFNIQQTST